MPNRTMRELTDKHMTLCWDCEKAFGRCSWSKDFVPVENWNAEPTKVWNGKDYVESFDVYECPEFELRERLKKRGADNDR